MTISYTSALRDQVTLTLLNRTYANCTTEEQTLLDGAISSGSLPLNAPTGGVALDTYKALAQVVQWFSEAGTGDTAIPDAFGPAYKAEMVARLARCVRPAEFGALVGAARSELQMAIDHYTPEDWSDSSQMFGLTINPQRIRLHVLRNCVRRRPRLLIPPGECDLALKWAFNHLTQRGAWLFRVRDITISVPTTNGGSAPTFTGMASGETFDSLLSVRLYHVDTRGLVSGDYVLPGSPDRFSEVSSIYESQTPTTGQPQHFRLENRAGTVYWQWAPKPDKTYTLRGQALVSTPAMPSAATSTTELGKFPAEFATIFPDLVLAKVLRDHSSPNWQDVWNRVDDEVGRWAYHYQKMVNDWVDEPRDIYRDENYQSYTVL